MYTVRVIKSNGKSFNYWKYETYTEAHNVCEKILKEIKDGNRSDIVDVEFFAS